MNIAILGCGKMSSAIVKGIHAKFKNLNFYTYTPSYTRAKELAEQVNGIAVKNPNEFPKIDWWLIGCKPQQVSDLAEEFAIRLKGQKIISILAATSTDSLSTLFESKKIIRIMPNTPSEYGLGISLGYFPRIIKEDEKTEVIKWFEACGVVYNCKTENDFNNLTLITGSGPAYIFQLAAILESILQKYGVDNKDESKKIMTQLFKGAGELMENQSIGFSQMLENVCSKGGVTIEAINKILSYDINKIYKEAVESGIKRSNIISEQISRDIAK